MEAGDVRVIVLGSSTSLSAGSGITATNLVMRIIRRLNDDTYTDVNTNNLLAAGTSATVATDATTRYSIGDVLDWAADGTFDAAVVTATAATALTLRRSYLGTTAADHNGSTTPKEFRVKPRWLSKSLKDLADEALDDLWPDIYLVSVATYTPTATPDYWYSLPSGTEAILGAYQRSGTPTEIYTSPRMVGPQFVDTTFSSTGIAARITDVDSAKGTLYVVYASKCALADLTSAQVDIVVLGACRRALEGFSMRPSREGEDSVWDSPTKVNMLRQSERALRNAERLRLKGFGPSTSTMRRAGAPLYQGVP